jgi:hypothetical protein
MFHAVGFRRKIAQSAATLALFLSAVARPAEPSEPLTVTRLGDPESKLLISSASDNIGTPVGDAAGEFSRVISETVRAQQRSIEARCQSVDRASGPIAVRWAWEARCHYRRY